MRILITTDKNRTVIVVTHNSYIAEMADKIIVIRDGKLQQREPIDGDA
jgi:ABC-type lipoprotein export system ATPase subunit